MLLEGYGNSERYNNKQRGHFLNNVIRGVIGGKKVVDGEDRR